MKNQGFANKLPPYKGLLLNVFYPKCLGLFILQPKFFYSLRKPNALRPCLNLGFLSANHHYQNQTAALSLPITKVRSGYPFLVCEDTNEGEHCTRAALVSVVTDDKQKLICHLLLVTENLMLFSQRQELMIFGTVNRN